MDINSIYFVTLLCDHNIHGVKEKIEYTYRVLYTHTHSIYGAKNSGQ